MAIITCKKSKSTWDGGIADKKMSKDLWRISVKINMFWGRQ
jgi:hypothetical protein